MLRRATLVLFIAAALTGCRSDDGLQAFSSDGCSLFPDQDLITGDDWCSCCFEHDIAYWKGGTEAEREAADRALQACVTEKTDNAMLGTLMYEGVQAGGSPYFYNWYRWGYGWDYGRNYEPLTPDESARAKVLLEEYTARNPEPVCAD